MRFYVLTFLPLLRSSSGQLEPNYTSSSGVNIYNPSTFFNTTGSWSLMSKAGDTLYISGSSPRISQREPYPETLIY